MYPTLGRQSAAGCTHISVLDVIQCVHDDSTVILHGVQPSLVFAHLVMNRGRPASAETLGNLLWTDHLAAHWEGAVRGVVAKIRAFLQHAGNASARIENVGHTYRLVCAPTTLIDIWQAETDMRAAEVFLERKLAVAAATHSARAVERLGGTLLPGLQHHELDQWRSDVASLRRRALRLASTAASNCRHHERAAAYAEAAVADEPFDEESHRAVIAAYLQAGNRGQALRAYGRCRQILASELGVTPSPTTEALYILALGAEPIGSAATGHTVVRESGRMPSAQTMLLCGEA